MTLSNVRTTTLRVPATPFGVQYSLERNVAFVALNRTLGVLNTTTFTPSLAHQIPLPAKFFNSTVAEGNALTHDGHYLLQCLGTGAVIIDVAKAVTGSTAAIVGNLNGSYASTGNQAIEVTITADDTYAFISQEYGPQNKDPGELLVFKLHKPTATSPVSSTYIGHLSLGDAVVGTALSPCGRYLYATSEQLSPTDLVGSLSVIDVAKLTTDPSTALLSSTAAGCNPVRVLVSSDGAVVWVTARASNHLLAFDAAKLLSNASEALLASVQVGSDPVGLIFAKDQSRIITCDSNRFNYTNSTTGLSVVDVGMALRGEAAVLGRIPTGLFPREIALSPDNGTLLVSDYMSMEVQAVDVATLP